ncbi:MAG: hypothetical protein H0T42_17140 [Deltaproteobacteria bacterium]|nr:hypothetical protein [Deltaproteobacteria bacterium]
MNIDMGRFPDILRAQHPGPLSPIDAEVIVAIAQLAVDADGHEEAEEIKMFFALGKAVFGLAGMAEAPTPTFASGDDDGERLVTLARQLIAVPSRELAYSVAHLLTISDIAISPEEDDLLVDLRTALEITEDRAEELARDIGSAITPAI